MILINNKKNTRLPLLTVNLLYHHNFLVVFLNVAQMCFKEKMAKTNKGNVCLSKESSDEK